MNPPESLLAAFHQGDDPTTAALVIADWLDEHDQPERAAIIRGLAQRRGLLPGDERIFECDESIERARGQLRGPFLPAEGNGFDEGTPFVTPSDFPSWASEFYPTHMSRSAVIDFREGDSLAPMFASPWIEHIGSLELRHCERGTDIPEVLARERHRLNLRHLIVGSPGNWSAEELTQVVGFAGLRSLSTTIETVSQLREGLSGLPSAATLERLEIREGDGIIRYLQDVELLTHWLNPHVFPRLRRLELSYLTFVNPGTTTPIINLSSSNVTELVLDGIDLTHELANLLGTLPLQVLDMRHLGFESGENATTIVPLLLQSSHLRRIRCRYTSIEPEIIVALAASPARPSIVDIDLLTAIIISPEVLDEFIALTATMQLRRLILPVIESGVSMLESLATHLPAGVLRELSVGSWLSLPLISWSEGLSRLIRCPGVIGLRTLRLQLAQLGEAGIALIARSAMLPELRHLTLERTGATPAAITELMYSPRLPKLSLIHITQESWLAGETPTLPTGWQWFPDRSQAMAAYAIRDIP